ncbi:non-ribosomal peptide synthetase [Methylosinus sp. RM1]|uniref:non-ribosomal peptide synthetase n=1 Tax=Methylosinus sp. RM1 TaxID=2583817 RepID=UPI00140CC040|nr:non-ribosomal peptide synthetase [Methylosinus sp. RM1]
MNAAELMSEMQSRGIRIYLDDGRVRCAAPAGAVTEEIRQALATHKGSIVAALSQTHRHAPPAIQPHSRLRPAPLSYGQRRLWFLDRLDPGNASYNVPAALRLTGRFDSAAFISAINEIVRRHEVLRTTFTMRDGEPVQTVAPVLEIAAPMIDLSGVDATTREAGARRLVDEEARRPFDLATGPLLRTLVIDLGLRADTGEREHIVAFTLHHIVSDGWSTDILVREFAALYEAFVGGGSSSLPPLALQYADYAAWQRDWLGGEVLERQLAYWRNELAGAPPSLDLPTDRPRPAAQDHAGAVCRFPVTKETTEGLRRLGRKEGATLFMTLLAAFQLLLSRYSGQSDICVGTPVANRRRVEFEGLIGCFVNTLVLRTDLSGDPTFRVLLARVRKTALGAQENQDAPFERLVDELQPLRDISRSPLFQTLFVLQNAPGRELALPGLQVEPLATDSGSAKFDLTLSLVEADGGLSGRIDYATTLFDPQTIERLARHYCALLAGIVADPDRRASELPMLCEAERRRLLVEWNDTATDDPRDKCLHQLFEEQAAKTPDAVAVAFEDAYFTYDELNARANRLAHRLIGLGVGAETVVGICVERSLEMVVGLLGVLKAGGAYLPLDPDYPSERLAYVIEDARPALVLTQERLRARLPESIQTLRLDADWTSIAREPRDNPAARATPQNLAYVIYTSGSTGRPKGVAVAHGGVVNYTRAINDRLADGKRLRFAMVSTLAADLGNTALFPSLTSGGCLHVIGYETATDANAMADYMRRHAIDVLKIVPSHYGALTHSGGAARLQPRKALIFGGEALSGELAESVAFNGSECRIFNHYGPTETTIGALMSPLNVERRSTLAPPIGRPIRNVEVYLLDAHMRPSPIGVAGELYIGGVGLARGYFGRADLTAERFVPNPFGAAGERLYRTGDLARYRANGDVEFLGRVDNQVKIRGFRIELGEIETALSRIPGVRDAVVTAREDNAGEKRLVAYVAGRENAALSAGELRAALGRALPDPMIPSAFVVLDALPLTRNGKIDRKALPAPDAAALPSSRYVAPRTPVEWLIAREFEQVLEISPVGIDDNFFHLGGDSLSGVKLVDRIRSAVCSSLPVTAIFQAPTIAQLSSWISGEQGYVPLVLMRRGHDVSPLYCIHPAGGSIIRYQALAEALDGVLPVYGIQSRTIFDPTHFDTSIEDMSAIYVDAVRRRQPRGPYHLLGWSMGGVIAMAMTARLEEQGEDVAFLGLLDTQLWSERRRTSRTVLDYLDQFAKFEGKEIEGLLAPDDYEHIRGVSTDLSERERFVYAAQWGQERGFWRNISADLVNFLYSDAENAKELTRGSALRPICASMHVWWARRSLADGGGFPVDWRSFTRGSVTIDVIDGDHDEIVRKPELHASLRTALRSIQNIRADVRVNG